ncbi:MAG TPA: glycosyltransferase family 4 protein [Azospirillaceae bacterium]|nr:glycosyltransferase family 4 protein [Azospirillaceae bacterium]
MRVAQIAPLAESVPPKFYGGTERIVSYLTEELVALGHDVTLFASGDSDTTAGLIAGCPRAIRLDPAVLDPLPHHLLMLEQVRRQAEDFDILHFHIDLLHFPLFRSLGDRVITTLHGQLDLPDLWPFFREFNNMPLVSISDAQREPMPPVRWAGTVYHGVPAELYRLHPTPGSYLAFLGRMSPEKQPEHAIEIARRSGIPLKMAAKVDKVDRAFFEARVKPLLDHPLIEFIGEIGDQEKDAFLGNALALLFPIDWPEPFGLVMIEAMACGTPVVAYRCGSVLEVVDDGVTGFVVDGVDSAVAAVGRLGLLDRAQVRSRFEERFSAARMAADYVALYEKAVTGWGGRRPLETLIPPLDLPPLGID